MVEELTSLMTNPTWTLGDYLLQENQYAVFGCARLRVMTCSCLPPQDVCGSTRTFPEPGPLALKLGYELLHFYIDTASLYGNWDSTKCIWWCIRPNMSTWKVYLWRKTKWKWKKFRLSKFLVHASRNLPKRTAVGGLRRDSAFHICWWHHGCLKKSRPTGSSEICSSLDSRSKSLGKHMLGVHVEFLKIGISLH